MKEGFPKDSNSLADTYHIGLNDPCSSEDGLEMQNAQTNEEKSYTQCHRDEVLYTEQQPRTGHLVHSR